MLFQSTEECITTELKLGLVNVKEESVWSHWLPAAVRNRNLDFGLQIAGVIVEGGHQRLQLCHFLVYLIDL